MEERQQEAEEVEAMVADPYSVGNLIVDIQRALEDMNLMVSALHKRLALVASIVETIKQVNKNGSM